MPTLRAPSQRAASNVRSSSASTTTRWKLAQMSATSCGVRRGERRVVGRCRPAARRSARARAADTAVFSPREAEIHPPRDVGGSMPAGAVGCGALRSACVSRARREIERAVVPLRATRSIDRPARIPEPEQLRHLVVRLPRRIVARAADRADSAPGFGHEIQAGVPARHDQHRRRQRHSPCASTSDSMCPARWCTGTTGMPRAQARPSRTRRRRAASPPVPAPASPRPRRDPPPTTCALLERALDDAADVAHVLARRQLRHDAAPLAMDVGLRRDDARADRPGPRGIAASRPRPPRRSRRRTSRCARTGRHGCYVRSGTRAAATRCRAAGRCRVSVMMPAM